MASRCRFARASEARRDTRRPLWPRPARSRRRSTRRARCERRELGLLALWTFRRTRSSSSCGGINLSALESLVVCGTRRLTVSPTAPAPCGTAQEFRKKANVPSLEAYQAMYKRSVEDPSGFWGDIAREFHWRAALTVPVATITEALAAPYRALLPAAWLHCPFPCPFASLPQNPPASRPFHTPPRPRTHSTPSLSLSLRSPHLHPLRQTPFDPKAVLKSNFDTHNGPIFVEWFKGGKTNMSYNCLDKHILEGRGDHVAMFWEGAGLPDPFSIRL